MAPEKKIFRDVFRKRTLPLCTYLLTVSLLSVFCSVSYSQEIDPRAYANMPVGSNIIVMNYAYTSGNIVSDAGAPIQNLELSANSINAGYLRSFSLFGKLARIQVVVPFTFITGDAKLGNRDTSGARTGFADSRIRFGVNLVGSPVLTPKEFVKHVDGFVLGTSLIISMPTGQYFTDKLINIGTNRWGFKPEIGVSQRFRNFYGELYAGVWFYTTNNEYFGTRTLSTDPLFNIQGQVNYIFPNLMWAGLNAAYSTGGEVEVDGSASDTRQDNWRLGLVFSTPITRQLSAKLQYHTGAVVRRGSDFDYFSVSFNYLWF